MLMKVNKSMFYISGHIYEGNVTLFSKIQIENLDRASGVHNQFQDLMEHFPKKFKNFPTLMMYFKVLGSSRMSFESLSTSLT